MPPHPQARRALTTHAAHRPSRDQRHRRPHRPRRPARRARRPCQPQHARGRRWHCPIAGHDDEHPSVTMYTDSHGHQRWRCWSGDDPTAATPSTSSSRSATCRPATPSTGSPTESATPPTAPPSHPNLGPDERPGPARPGRRHLCDTGARSSCGPHNGAPYDAGCTAAGSTTTCCRVNHIGADPGRRVLPRRRRPTRR